MTYSPTRSPVFHDGQEITIGDRCRRYLVCAHEAGPHSDPHGSLVPCASVIDGRRPAPAAGAIQYGDTICIAGLGDHLVLRNAENPDWPRVVPMFGGRFYVDFRGQGEWRVRDREREGQVVSWETRRSVMETLGLGRFDSIDKARLVAAFLSAFVPTAEEVAA